MESGIMARGPTMVIIAIRMAMARHDQGRPSVSRLGFPIPMRHVAKNKGSNKSDDKHLAHSQMAPVNTII